MYCISVALLFALSVLSVVEAQSYSATYLPSGLPEKTEKGQTGTNQCGTGSNQTSNCQNAYINSIEDWCIWGPPKAGPESVIGNIERYAVAWCTKNGTGTRLIPNGAITGAHFVQTPDFVQVTGVGNLQLINVPKGDQGGEMDPHGADGNGNPIGGLVFSSAFGKLQQLHEWTNFISDTAFCFRACKPGPMATKFCEHIYDVMGCEWNIPANYSSGVFETCQGDSGTPMGVYGSSTFHQGEPITPLPHPAPSSSSCTTFSSIGAVSTAGTNTAISTTSGISASATTTGPSVTSPSTANATNANSAGSKTTSIRFLISIISFTVSWALGTFLAF